ncbi:L-cystine ABC transporter ATP-binding protein YecC, partial [Streptomyces sp. NPDC059515]
PLVVSVPVETSPTDPQAVGGVLAERRPNGATPDITMLCVTHEMTFARDISDQVLMFDSGRVIESGSPEKLFGDPDHERTREFLSTIL